VQEFEVELRVGGHDYKYVLHLTGTNDGKRPLVAAELASCDGRTLFERDHAGVIITLTENEESRFPLDQRQAALGAIQPASNTREIQILQNALTGLLILRPNPRAMEGESKSPMGNPGFDLSRLVSWYQFLCQDQEWADSLRESLRDVWPDFASFQLLDVGQTTKALSLLFDSPSAGQHQRFYFDQLSDGEKALVALYMVRAALATGAANTVFIDEPDNYVGLPELQPWVLSLREILDDDHQAILISHHPEILSSAGEEFGRYLWRKDHTSPTQVSPLKVPVGLTPAEAIARGWIGG